MKKTIALLALSIAGTAGASFTTIGEVTDFGDGSYFIDTGADFGTSASAADLENALQLSPGYLDFVEDAYDGFNDGDVIGGSAIYTTEQILVGNTISFDWTWSTNEPIFSLNVDFAFITISDGAGFEAFGVFADTFAASGTSGTFSFTNDGFIPQGPQYTIGIGVVNVDIFDPAFADSFLDVSNFSIVPTPAPLVLLALGLIGLGAARRK